MTAGTIRRIEPLGDDPFERHRAGLRQHARAGLGKVIAVMQAEIRAAEKLLKRRLAFLERLRAQIRSVQEEEVERVVMQLAEGAVLPVTAVGLVTRGSDDTPLAIHRTFLARDGSGKAPVDPQKMMLGPCRARWLRGSPALHRPALH